MVKWQFMISYFEDGDGTIKMTHDIFSTSITHEVDPILSETGSWVRDWDWILPIFRQMTRDRNPGFMCYIVLSNKVLL